MLISFVEKFALKQKHNWISFECNGLSSGRFVCTCRKMKSSSLYEVIFSNALWFTFCTLYKKMHFLVFSHNGGWSVLACSFFIDETKKERHASVPLWMFTQRNNPYCVYPSNFVGAKVVLFYEITKYFRKNLYISCIFCNFAAKLESLCPSLFIEILIKQPSPFLIYTCSRCVYPSNCPLKSWQNNQ